MVAQMGSYAASGGYRISASTDHIVASPSTITGSIGVFGLFMTYEKSLDYLGINSDGVSSTELADISAARGMAPVTKTSFSSARNVLIQNLSTWWPRESWMSTRLRYCSRLRRIGETALELA